MKTRSLTHIAMSVPAGTLNDEWRAQVLAFYGEHFGWIEMDDLRRPDRLTIATGPESYVNIRERSDAMTVSGYEHFGVAMRSASDTEQLWTALHDAGLDPSPLDQGADGYRSFRFGPHLLPLAVEVQYFPSSQEG